MHCPDKAERPDPNIGVRVVEVAVLEISNGAAPLGVTSC